MSDVREIMLRRFGVLYGEPKTSDLPAFVAEYERAIGGTRRDIVEAATDLLVKTTERRSWPTPGECYKAVQQCAERVDFKSRNDGSRREWHPPIRSLRAPDSPGDIERWRQAAEWRRQVTEPYGGSMDKYLTANRHRMVDFFDASPGKQIASKRSAAESIGKIAARITGDRDET